MQNRKGKRLGPIGGPGCAPLGQPVRLSLLGISEYFAILVTINRDAQWNQSDSVWDRVLNFENLLKAITLSCFY